MPQTRERRMYLMWRAAKARHDYRRGEQHTPHLRVAMRFGLPVCEVKDIVAAQRTNPTTKEG
ncbi:hypothetical protein [Streptacidiphilus sp. PAMC 29251]